MFLAFLEGTFFCFCFLPSTRILFLLLLIALHEDTP